MSPVPVSITSPTAKTFSAFGSSSLPASVGIVVVLSAVIAPLTKTVVPKLILASAHVAAIYKVSKPTLVPELGSPCKTIAGILLPTAPEPVAPALK